LFGDWIWGIENFVYNCLYIYIISKGIISVPDSKKQRLSSNWIKKIASILESRESNCSIKWNISE